MIYEDISIDLARQLEAKVDYFFMYSGIPDYLGIIIGLWKVDLDQIVQFDPPDDPLEYIHRVGRTVIDYAQKDYY